MSRRQNVSNKSMKSGSRPGPGRNQVQTKRKGAKSSNGKGFNNPGTMSMAPVSRTQIIRTARPKMTVKSNGDCVITHREYIQDTPAPTSSNFLINSLAINPGQQAIFPWLSKIAQNFESYRFKKLHFLFETECATSNAGSQFLSVDYDSSDSTPTSKVVVMAYRNSVRTAVWAPCKHVSEPEDLNKLKSYYVRPGAQPAGTDIKLYDVGKLLHGTQGASNTGIGELYVEYTIELITPLYTTTFGDAEKSSAVGVAGQAGAKPFGTTSLNLVQIESGQPLTTFDNTGAGTFTFQRSFSGLVVIEYIGTVITAIAAATGTATKVDLGSSVDTAGLLTTSVYSVVASQSQTFTVGALTATTVTSAIMRLVPWNVATFA